MRNTLDEFHPSPSRKLNGGPFSFANFLSRVFLLRVGAQSDRLITHAKNRDRIDDGKKVYFDRRRRALNQTKDDSDTSPEGAPME
jgi:hypothetical protein